MPVSNCAAERIATHDELHLLTCICALSIVLTSFASDHPSQDSHTTGLEYTIDHHCPLLFIKKPSNTEVG